jgi:hypothetical protein
VNSISSPVNSQAKAIAYRPKRAALNWVDFLVIAATILTFATVVAVNNPHAARAQTRSNVISAAELPLQTSQLHDSSDLMKAKLGVSKFSNM